MHRRNNPVAMFKPQPLENVILPNVHTWIRRRLKKFSCWIFPSLRAKREKKIKAMERDVIFFLSLLPRIFERPPVREIYEDRKKERKGERERETCTKKPPYVFFTCREEFITTVQLPPPSPSCRIFSLLLFLPLPSFTPFIIPPPLSMVFNSIFVFEAIHLSREKQAG